MPELFCPNSIASRVSFIDNEGHVMYCEQHYRGDNPVTSGNVADAHAATTALWTGAPFLLSGLISENITLTEIKTYATDREGGPFLDTAFSVVGGTSGGITAASTCPLVMWECGVTGRRAHGRMYMPYTAQGNLVSASERQWKEAFITAVEEPINAWIEGFSFGSVVPAVVSYKWQVTNEVLNSKLMPTPAVRKGREIAR